MFASLLLFFLLLTAAPSLIRSSSTHINDSPLILKPVAIVRAAPFVLAPQDEDEEFDDDFFDKFYDDENTLKERPRSPATPVPQHNSVFHSNTMFSSKQQEEQQEFLVESEGEVSSSSTDFFDENDENASPPPPPPTTSTSTSSFTSSDFNLYASIPVSDTEPLSYSELDRSMISFARTSAQFSSLLNHLTKGNPGRMCTTSNTVYDQMILECHIEIACDGHHDDEDGTFGIDVDVDGIGNTLLKTTNTTTTPPPPKTTATTTRTKKTIQTLLNWHKIVHENITEKGHPVTGSFLLLKSKLYFLHLPIDLLDVTAAADEMTSDEKVAQESTTTTTAKTTSSSDVDPFTEEMFTLMRYFLTTPTYYIEIKQKFDAFYILYSYNVFLKSLLIAIETREEEYDFLCLVPFLESLRSRVRRVLQGNSFCYAKHKEIVESIKKIEGMLPAAIVDLIECPITKLHAIMLFMIPCDSDGADTDIIDTTDTTDTTTDTVFLDPLLCKNLKEKDIFQYVNDIYLHFLFVYQHVLIRFTNTNTTLQDADEMVLRLQGLLICHQLRKAAFELMTRILRRHAAHRCNDLLELCECILLSQEFVDDTKFTLKIRKALSEANDLLVCPRETVTDFLAEMIAKSDFQDEGLPPVIDADFALNFMKGTPHSKGRLNHQKHATCAVKMIYQILSLVYPILDDEENIVHHRIGDSGGERVVICGDIHGQFNDILEIMQNQLGAFPSPKTVFIFNGDVVDRGDNSLECLLALLIWKIALPESIWITRGNHESESMNSIMGLKDELQRDYGEAVGEQIFRAINLTMCALPLCHRINGDVLVMHGGIPLPNAFFPHLRWKERIAFSERRYEPVSNQFISQIMWNDPLRGEGEKGHRAPYRQGCRLFRASYTESFMEENEVSLIVRSHEWFKDGHAIHQDGRVITVFSATDYLNGHRSNASFIVLSLACISFNDGGSICSDDGSGGKISSETVTAETTLKGNPKVQSLKLEIPEKAAKSARTSKSGELSMQREGVFSVGGIGGSALSLEIHTFGNRDSLLDVDAGDGSVFDVFDVCAGSGGGVTEVDLVNGTLTTETDDA